MAKKIETATENKNIVMNTETAELVEQVEQIVAAQNEPEHTAPVKKWNGPQQWLIKRMEKVLDHNAVTTELLDHFLTMVKAAKGNIKQREIDRIDEEIARLKALKAAL